MSNPDPPAPNMPHPKPMKSPFIAILIAGFEVLLVAFTTSTRCNVGKPFLLAEQSTFFLIKWRVCVFSNHHKDSLSIAFEQQLFSHIFHVKEQDTPDSLPVRDILPFFPPKCPIFKKLLDLNKLALTFLSPFSGH